MAQRVRNNPCEDKRRESGEMMLGYTCTTANFKAL
jgi:hypothetical protein